MQSIIFCQMFFLFLTGSWHIRQFLWFISFCNDIEVSDNTVQFIFKCSAPPEIALLYILSNSWSVFGWCWLFLWVNIIFMTRKTKICLLSLKLIFDKNRKPHVLYQISCTEREYTFASQTCRQVTRRINEHQKIDSLVGQLFSDCYGSSKAFPQIIDQCSETEQLITLAALQGNENLKLIFDKNRKPHVLYQISCTEREYTFASQTCRQVTRRINEHQKIDSLVGQHFSDCYGSSKAFPQIIDQCSETEKLITLAALQGNENRN